MIFQDVPEIVDADLHNEREERRRRSKLRHHRQDGDAISRGSTKAWRRRRATFADADDEWEFEEDDPTEPKAARRPPGPTAATAVPTLIEEAEARAALWLAVIATAVDDVEEGWQLANKPRLTASEERKSRLLLAEAPAEFLEGRRFQEICDLLGLQPGWVWRNYDLSRFGLVTNWDEKTRRGAFA